MLRENGYKIATVKAAQQRHIDHFLVHKIKTKWPESQDFEKQNLGMNFVLPSPPALPQAEDEPCQQITFLPTW